MFVTQVIVLFLLPYFTTSHPSHKRETNQVSISKSSQNVINDGTPVNSEPVSSSPHTAALSYHHLKEVIENSVNFLNRRSASSSVIVDSSAFHSHEKISLGKAPSDTTNLEAPMILVDGSMNRKVESHVTSTKSIKSSIKTAPTISKRFNVKSLRPSNWNWNNLRKWGSFKKTNPMTGAANQGLQRTQTMPNFQGTQGFQPGQANQNRMPSNAVKSAANQGLQRAQSMPNLQATQEFQPGQVNQNRMPNNAVKINNENKAGSTFISGLKSRWQKFRGKGGSQASLQNNANVVQGNSPTASSAIASDKSSVQISPMGVASNEKNLKRPAFEIEDSQTESYSRNRNRRTKAKLNSHGLADPSAFSSEGTPKTHKGGEKNNNPNTPNYISSSNGKSGPSSAKRGKFKSTLDRFRRKKKSSNADSRLPETNSGNTEKIISPGEEQTRNSLVSSDFSDSSDAQSEAKSRTHGKRKKKNNLNIPIFDAGYYRSSTDSEESDSSSSSNLRNTKSTINRHKKIKTKTLSDTESSSPESNSVNTGNKISPVGNEIQNPEELTQFRNFQFIDQKSEPPHGEMDVLRSMNDRTTNPHSWNRPPHEYGMDDYEMGGRVESAGYYSDRNTGSRIANAIENTTPLVSVLTNIATGNGNMGLAAGSYGNDYDHMDPMGGLGMAGYGSNGYGSNRYGASGFGAGGSMGRFGANEYGSDIHGSHGLDGGNIGGDPVDAHEPLDETRSKAVEKSTHKSIRKTKKKKKSPKRNQERSRGRRKRYTQ
ncbi:hypothetical protein OnM2_092028 [Erysiphe neolycopersici]|uniref:Uncharacterized protein n=1 Tax=Erysiphe neolycopersici TaxID=212602 RepID=A0A420HCA6_9PEZI|nr:hypothetical protein OnM2_092028 [Erysiphe neolycopersici]